MGDNLGKAVAFDGSVRLTDWALLRAHGADAAAFLQSQLTQDVAGLQQGEARLSGYCSPKGRLLASFIIWRMSVDEFALLCSADVAAAARKRLSMFVLRARCRIDDAAAQWSVFGIAGDSAAPWASLDVRPWTVRRQADQWLIGLSTVEQVPRWLLVQPVGMDAPALPTLSAQAWQLLEVMSGVPRITAATADRFVPQMINFEIVGGVHFQKGCYPGQEVVARSQYRGTIKRRMHLFATSGSTQPGQEVFHNDDAAQPAGMVVNSAELAGSGTRLLAEVKLAALDSGSLHLGTVDGPVLQRLPLPYPIADLAHA
ncbi:MAG TPA: folate-binding protein [Burkholderiaceae bacterium]|nr:folate-binding protein [Burkholderiaceae bacterium]